MKKQERSFSIGVVLAGWLGCRRKALRRYERLYKTLGVDDVICRIASPVMVIEAAISSSRQADMMHALQKFLEKCKQSSISDSEGEPENMHELAWDVVGAMHKSPCAVFIFHGFSNGGGFLWEQVRGILNINLDQVVKSQPSSSMMRSKQCKKLNPLMSSDVASMVTSVKRKLMGVVFDSSPAYYCEQSGRSVGESFKEALSFCTEQEREQVHRRISENPVSFNQRRQRALEYWEGMIHDHGQTSWPTASGEIESGPSGFVVRQLYLYSEDDGLTDAKWLRQLILQRQAQVGKGRIWSRQWKSSPHCSHIVYHADDYSEAVSSFVTAISQDVRIHSHDRVTLLAKL